MIPVELTGDAFWLPLVFVMLMGVAIFAYVILDGYDLGVGILLPRARSEHERDLMIASIGPFWDANETWLVLGVGLLLVAFPKAHGLILTQLYLPVTLMLVGLILRGVAFDFRVKVKSTQKALWDRLFFIGSLLAAIAQGVMLGQVVTGFDHSWIGWLFAVAIGLGLAGGYTLLGAGWLIMKSEGDLQLRAVRWGRQALLFTALGIGGVSIATPVVSPRIFDKWFSLDTFLGLLPIPLMTVAIFVLLAVFFRRLDQDARLAYLRGLRRWAWAPFAGTVTVFVLAFLGLSYSLFPYLVIDRMTFWQAASATESLWIILWGALFVLPAILGYTVFAYRIFWGKTQVLGYQ